jgi:hypothetical protein
VIQCWLFYNSCLVIQCWLFYNSCLHWITRQLL